jgi:DDE family transposase
MGLDEHLYGGETAMSRARSPLRRAEPESFLDCLRYFLTPQVWKQVHQAFRPWSSLRWRPQPLVFVLLMMTWCGGESLPERFETAKAFYIASYQRKRRPGKTIEGFTKALTRIPATVLRRVADALRCRLAQVFAERFKVNGFVPLGCDGSSLACPRTAELQRRLGGEREGTPQVWVTAIVHLSLGLLWSWRLGKGNANEREHLRQLVRTLPADTLLVTDAGYPGYELLQTLQKNRVSFLMRLFSKAPLYATERVALGRFREGLVYYWPQEMQRQKRPPIQVRLLRIRARHVPGRNVGVWLITNVLEKERLSRQSAGQFYRWRWRNEGLFRTYKRTLGKVKLMGRTVAMVHREAEGSLLAVQLLLAQGSLALHLSAEATVVLPSARKVLLAIRAEIRNVTGMYLGPRQQQTFLHRLEQARDADKRKRRRNRVRQSWPSRHDHKPPGRPKILKMGTDLKDLLRNVLDVA